MSALHKHYEKIQLNKKFSESVQYMTIYISVIYSENYAKFYVPPILVVDKTGNRLKNIRDCPLFPLL